MALAPYHHAAIMLSIPRAEFQRLCELFALQIQVSDRFDNQGAPLDPLRLLLALGGQESDYGAKLKPRYLPEYDVGGQVHAAMRGVQRFIAQHGSAGAFSYGPLQVVAFYAIGFTPAELVSDPEAAMAAAVAHLQRDVLGGGAFTLEDICAVWHAATPRSESPAHYCASVARRYAAEGANQELKEIPPNA